jgi:uncharacterized protein
MPRSSLSETISSMELVDAHCHRVLEGPVDAAGFELAATEATRPAPPGVSHLDGAVGLAIRRWCAPVLGLDGGAPIDQYLARRSALGAPEVTRRLLGAAGLSHLLVDTGPAASGLMPTDALAGLAGAEVRQVVRLEDLAHALAARGVAAAELAPAYVEELAKATRDAVAVKSIVAYRHGLRVDPRRPDPVEVHEAARRWMAGPALGRLDDPVLERFVLWCGVDRGLPLQVHTGFGDRDLALAESDPALLQPFLEAVEPTGTPVVLLHCYPYHRHAGWLAQVFPNVYVDVGLTVAQVGARADAVLAELFELAPFGKLLFSSDGYQLPELYLVGAAQFRHSLTGLLEGWVAAGVMRADEAERLAVALGSGNAKRLYNLP